MSLVGERRENADFVQIQRSIYTLDTCGEFSYPQSKDPGRVVSFFQIQTTSSSTHNTVISRYSSTNERYDTKNALCLPIKKVKYTQQ